jgi:hypothetical protein
MTEQQLKELISEVREKIQAYDEKLKTLETEKKIDGLLTEPSRDYKVGDIIGSTKAMRDIFKTIGVVSQSRATSSSRRKRHGKELTAKVIHNTNKRALHRRQSSPRRDSAESSLRPERIHGRHRPEAGKFELAGSGRCFDDQWMSINLQRSSACAPGDGVQRWGKIKAVPITTNRDPGHDERGSSGRSLLPPQHRDHHVPTGGAATSPSSST